METEFNFKGTGHVVTYDTMTNTVILVSNGMRYRVPVQDTTLTASQLYTLKYNSHAREI